VACGSGNSPETGGTGETLDATSGPSPDGAEDPSSPAGDGGVLDGSNGADATGDGASTSDGATTSDGGDGGDAAASNDDPFDPLSCTGTALTSVQALARLGVANHVKLADATLFRRTRTCSGSTAATCGAWTAPVPHTQALLTYSGGVVTDYKTFSFPTHLVLFAQAASPKLSIRHVSDYMHDATASTRGVQFGVGGPSPLVNTYPVIYVWDFAPAPNRYEDLQGKLGDEGRLTATASCARVVFPTGITTEVAALYRY
jgi:hypothetical protein